MRVQRESRGEGEARLLCGALSEEDLGEMQHGGKVPRLELQRAVNILQALGISSEEIVERGALVPRFGVLRRAAQQNGEARLGDVVALGGDVARRGVENGGGGPMGMMHPRPPDAVF